MLKERTRKPQRLVATVAVLMELATRYLHPLPDTLFQIQGAYVTVTARESDGLCTKDPPPLWQVCQSPPSLAILFPS